MRIAIVNDLPMAVEVLRRVVGGAGHEIAWTAANGAEAVARCGTDRPDIVLMDLIMPVMDGAQATRLIMERSPCAILVVTATVSGNAAKVFEAMGNGALDAAATPVLGTAGGLDGAAELLRKLAVVGRLVDTERHPPPASYPAVSPLPLIAIGASTGGPKALSTLLASLPADFPAAVVVVQHVDVQFAPGLAEWLNQQTALEVGLAVEGAEPKRGTVSVAATNDHLVISPAGAFQYVVEPARYPYRPSVDEFFLSIAKHWPPSMAVLLTGMGQDGARGLLALREAGWYTIAQDEGSSIVYGMPKAAAARGAAVEMLPPPRIGERMMERFTHPPRTTNRSQLA